MQIAEIIVSPFLKRTNHLLMRIFLFRCYDKQNIDYLNKLTVSEPVDNYVILNHSIFVMDETIQKTTNCIAFQQKRELFKKLEKNKSIAFEKSLAGNIIFPFLRIYWEFRIINFKYRKK